MAAYAALVSLMNTMEQILNHSRLSTSLDKKQMESLQEKAGFLLDFIESYNSHGVTNKEEVEDLESQIASAAHAAEDVIESHVVYQILAGSTEESSNLLLDLQEVMEDLDSIKETVTEVKEKWGFKQDQPIYSTTATLSRPLNTGKNTMVGFDDILIQFMDMLTGQSSSRQVIPIVGMGGIGKTTFARNVYENSLIVQHFDIRAWATISQEYSVREILLELLSCQRKYTSETVDELGEQLYKSLSGRRYLVILDDMWSIDVWDRVKVFFPDNGNRSRIVITTRLSNMSICLCSSSFEMKFLDKNKSWNLFCKKAFGREDCPLELVKIGKKIAKQCKGLPLSIVVIGGLLRKSNKTKEYWENVAKNINSILSSGEDEQCRNVLSLSYSELPAHLKPCFLYMGVFPEYNKIYVSRLINLWVAEGFLKSNKAKSLEEVAEGYLKDLIERNLVLVGRMGPNKKIRTCGIHDLLRELCLREAKKEKFFQAMTVFDIPRGIDRERRIVLHGEVNDNVVCDALKSAFLARSLICDEGPLPFMSPLMRVLTNVDGDLLEDILHEQVNLRYLTYNSSSLSPYELPSSISLLWNVQTIIIRGAGQFIAPIEIWEMSQLRHLEFGEIFLPDPPPSDRVDQKDDFVLKNLQKLGNAANFRFSEDVCMRIPNIKKLRLSYNDFSGANNYCLNNLGRLHKLQSLKCLFYRKPERCDLLQNLAFPSTLQKLSLGNCHLFWEDLTRIGYSLPHLEVLKLEEDSIVGPQWDPVEGAFPRLKFLKICCSDLIYWTADNSHFPVLEELFLCNLCKLDEIPLDITGIPTLGCIRLNYCSLAAVVSSTKILEEQLSLGNEDFQVRVMLWDEEDKQRFLEEVEIESFTSKNLSYMVDGHMMASIRTHAQVIRAAFLFEKAAKDKRRRSAWSQLTSGHGALHQIKCLRNSRQLAGAQRRRYDLGSGGSGGGDGL